MTYGEIEIVGQWNRQSGIRLSPELWQNCPDERFVLGVEMKLARLKLRGYYLSPQFTQRGGRGTQRWLAKPIPQWTPIEFTARNCSEYVEHVRPSAEGIREVVPDAKLSAPASNRDSHNDGG